MLLEMNLTMETETKIVLGLCIIILLLFAFAGGLLIGGLVENVRQETTQELGTTLLTTTTKLGTTFLVAQTTSTATSSRTTTTQLQITTTKLGTTTTINFPKNMTYCPLVTTTTTTTTTSPTTTLPQELTLKLKSGSGTDCCGYIFKTPHITTHQVLGPTLIMNLYTDSKFPEWINWIILCEDCEREDRKKFIYNNITVEIASLGKKEVVLRVTEHDFINTTGMYEY